MFNEITLHEIRHPVTNSPVFIKHNYHIGNNDTISSGYISPFTLANVYFIIHKELIQVVTHLFAREEFFIDKL